MKCIPYRVLQFSELQHNTATKEQTSSAYIITYVVCMVLFLFGALMPIVASALEVKDFRFSHLDMADGLNSQRVFSLKQSSDHAVWLTTKSGVGRYNGSEVTNYYLSEAGTNYNMVGSNPHFVQTEGDEIEVYDVSGRIYQFNRVQNEFEEIANAAIAINSYYQLNDVCKDGNTYWIAMSEGIFLLRSGKLEVIAPDCYANCVIRLPNGSLLFGTRQGLKILDVKYKNTPQGNLRDYLPHVVISGYYDNTSKRLYLGTYSQGVLTVDDSGVCQPILGVPHNPVRSIVPYDDNQMLLGIDGCGVYKFDREAFETANPSASLLFNSNHELHGTLHGNGVYTLLVDHWRNIFIGSYSGGIDIAYPIGSTIAIYNHQRNNSQTLINDHVNCVAQGSNETLLLGTDDGISELHTETGVWRHLARGMVVLSICKAPNGRLLFATYGNGVCEIGPQGSVRQIYGLENKTLGDNNIFEVLYDKNEHLWMGCQDGELVEVTPDGRRNYYPIDNVQALAPLSDGRMVVGSINGIFLVTPGKRLVKELHYFSTDASKVNRYVLDVFIHNDRYMYIATDGGGVYVYDLHAQKCRQLTTANGLPSNSVTSVTLDNLGRLWFATDQGMAFVHSDNQDEVIDVNYCFGLQREYIRGASLCMTDGNLIFGSISGAIVINPRDVRKLDYEANLSFLNIVCDGTESAVFKHDVARMLEKGVISLGYRHRTFELHFECINMNNQYDIAYQYKVGNEGWSQLSTQRYIRFVNMEPGSHQLIVRAVSKTSHLVLDECQLTVTIAQPWWNSWWMWCIYIAFVVGLFCAAWWTYGLHSRYMRLVVQVLENDNTNNVRAKIADSKDVKESNDGRETIEPQELRDNRDSSVPNAIDEQVEQPNSSEQEAAANDSFVEIATKHILDHLSNSEYSIDNLCSDMAMSRTKFYIMLKSITGKSPQEFIRVVRLERAAVLLRSGAQIRDVAERTGFDNAKYFSTVFKNYFGISPSKFN